MSETEQWAVAWQTAGDWVQRCLQGEMFALVGTDAATIEERFAIMQKIATLSRQFQDGQKAAEPCNTD